MPEKLKSWQEIITLCCQVRSGIDKQEDDK